MEPRAERRKRRRRRQLKFISLAIFSLLSLTIGSSNAGLGTTQALAVSRQEGSASLGSLSTGEALIISANSVSVNELTAGDTLGAFQALEVRNRSLRSIPIEAAVTGAPGLGAAVNPPVLEPGGTAVVTLFGKPEKAGELQGLLTITGLRGFLRVAVPIQGLVKEPEVQCPPPAASTGPDTPDAAAPQQPGAANSEQMSGKCQAAPAGAPAPAPPGDAAPAPVGDPVPAPAGDPVPAPVGAPAPAPVGAPAPASAGAPAPAPTPPAQARRSPIELAVT